MTLEDQFIQKTYYKMFMNEHEQVQPIRVLGDLFQEEQQKDIPDLSYIRFAQGEVYFHNKDFETAIFKWENIANELEPWAKKNTADAYYELGMLPVAEDIYKSIATDQPVLKTEVALQLFSLYIERGKLDAAVTTIKQTVSQNPDYPNVTKLARSFFEKQQDWGNAIELAVNESIRTESVEWFDHLKKYLDMGLGKNFPPDYFSKSLSVLFHLDQARFEGLVSPLWNSFKKENTYFSWLREINQLLAGLEWSRTNDWSELSKICKETYFDLIGGKYLLSELQELISPLLANWLKLTDTKQAVWAATAVLSWGELFPSSVGPSVISDAEALFSHSEKNVEEWENGLQLFDSIMKWAESHDMGANIRLKWMAEQLTDFKTQHFLISGVSGKGKSSFVNYLLGGDIHPDEPTSSIAVFRDAEQLTMNEITDQEIIHLPGVAEFQERMERRRNALESILEFKRPNSFFHENQLALIDTPGLTGNYYDWGELLKYFAIADVILFVLDAPSSFTEQEKAILMDLRERVPDMSIHFLLNKMDTISQEEKATRIVAETRAAIHSFLPDAEVFAFSSKFDKSEQLQDLAGFIRSIKVTNKIEEKRLAKLLFFIRMMITTLLQKRIDVENQLIESIRWNEEMLQKLTGAINQLGDIEQQKTILLAREYHVIKEDIQRKISGAIPKLLKDCSNFIKEDSDFRKIHLLLNDEMNRRLQDYLENKAMPDYFQSLQGWIAKAKEEFEQDQKFLDEMGAGFNVLYGNERFKLDSDFKILEDWHRDTDRMTNRFQLEKVNILLRRTPSQLLLKSAGKLFGSLMQNKTMVYKKYKAFIETENYAEATKLVMNRFFQPFELFERSLGRDLSLFFRNPQNMLHQAVDDAHKEIAENQEKLDKIHSNPEMFRDPLKLFEVKLRQLEWMSISRKGVPAPK